MSTTPKTEKQVLTFIKIEKESTNCYRYQEQIRSGKPTVVGGLYVRKNAFKQVPAEIKVTLEVINTVTK